MDIIVSGDNKLEMKQCKTASENPLLMRKSKFNVEITFIYVEEPQEQL